jgi:hypothetical protein
MIEVYTPPTYYIPKNKSYPTIFLAGSIEMGNAEDWQKRVIDYCRAKAPFDALTFYNPRRADWDSSWVQSLNSPNFYEQVSWELDMLIASDIVYMYFDPSTQSPISLLELGMFANSGKMVVCCPDGFYRKGNVDVVCQKFNIPLFTDFDASLVALRNKIREYPDW